MLALISARTDGSGYTCQLPGWIAQSVERQGEYAVTQTREQVLGPGVDLCHGGVSFQVWFPSREPVTSGPRETSDPAVGSGRISVTTSMSFGSVAVVNAGAHKRAGRLQWIYLPVTRLDPTSQLSVKPA